MSLTIQYRNPKEGFKINSNAVIYIYGTSTDDFANITVTLNEEDLTSYLRQVSTSGFLFLYEHVFLGSEYTLTIADSDEENSIVFYSSEEKPFINPVETCKYSTYTQLMANEFPEWTDARNNTYSVTQQLLNPFAKEIEKLDRIAMMYPATHLPQTYDTDELAAISYVDLDNSFSFKIYNDRSGETVYVSPTVYGYRDGEVVLVSPFFANSIYDLENVIPNNIYITETEYEENEVLETTSINLLPITNFKNYNILYPSYLYLKIDDATNLTYINLNASYTTYVVINGRDEEGTKISEALFIPYSGTFVTKYKYSIVEQILFRDVHPDNVGALAVYLNKIAAMDQVDDLHYARTTIRKSLKNITWTLGANLNGTLLQQEILRSDELGFLDENIEIIREYELLDKQGSNVTITDFVTKSESEYIYAMDNKYLYVYDKRDDYSPYVKLLSGQTDNPAFIFLLEDITTARLLDGRQISLAIQQIRSTDKQVKYSIRIILPSRASYYLIREGELNPAINTLDDQEHLFEYDKETNIFNLYLPELGDYLIELNTYLGNEKHIYKLITSCYYKRPIAQYSLKQLQIL